jgi:uncharacterized protein
MQLRLLLGAGLLLVIATSPLASGSSSPPLLPPTEAPPTEAPNVLHAVPFEKVRILDRFWRDRIETNRRVTVEANLTKCEETGRLRNFAVAGGLVEGEFEGRLYNDSDVYKVLEGIAYTLAHEADEELEARTDRIIESIAAAQQADGYLNTYYTLVKPEMRWSNTAHGHELYCAGHLIEAGIAYRQATGKATLLEVGIRMADYIDSVFGPEGRLDPPGHQELELALFKLADAVGQERYRTLGEFFLLRRGDPAREELYGAYSQDAVGVLEQREATGHAVRAMYQYCAMADVARHRGASKWREALEAIWNDVVLSKMYITGGIGNSAHNEGFTRPFDLPNDSAYAETCAAIGMGLWNHRMFLLTREARYADILERELYNNVLAGVSQGGDRFFYVNALATDGKRHRVPWFDCSCCPTNIVRYIPGIGERIYAHDQREIFVALYVGSSAQIELEKGTVEITQVTDFPWDGKIHFRVELDAPLDFVLNLRVPGWYSGEMELGGALSEARAWSGPSTAQRVGGFGRWVGIDRTWSSGDEGTIEFAMPPRRVYSDPRVEANRGRVALQRGPLVYALEGIDHGGNSADLILPPIGALEVQRDPAILGGIPIIRGKGLRLVEEGDLERALLTAVPYCLWDNREAGDLTVWIPESKELARLPGEIDAVQTTDGTVRASHCYASDSLAAVSDGEEPASSNDHSIPRLSFWDHRGTKEWISFEWEATRSIDRAEVYWFDDTGRGSCRVPAEWRLLWLDGDAWKEVAITGGGFGVEADRFNEVRFAPVETPSVKLEIELREGWSGGVLEWKLDAEK